MPVNAIINLFTFFFTVFIFMSLIMLELITAIMAYKVKINGGQCFKYQLPRIYRLTKLHIEY